MDKPTLAIVVPCYNENDVLNETAKQLKNVLIGLIDEALVTANSKIVFVDDGSKDGTWSLIEQERAASSSISGVKLSRNFGHQGALLAGIHSAKAWTDCIITIDADLQDDILVIREFVLRYLNGAEIVYGVRRSRETDSIFKRATAQAYYKFMRKLGIDLIYNHADFRLMSKRAVTELEGFEERNMFLRGIVPMLGLKNDVVYYDRKERFAGETKYPLKKMIAFAFNGLTSFSVVPIRLVSIIGFLSFCLSGLAGVYAVIQKLLGHTESGWTSIIISVWIIGGLMLMSMGLIGEYIGKIYWETKRRPAYIIESELTHDVHHS
ncbi:glycosyltransferase family 2 protein [Paenibacillus sp. OV219]|uniref:glycosyltransferase family 2 protein n=1 Tax=Paenibacillus sp. OV219 TaxID=1884377 RepID=UPI0008B4E0D0|nr:glycosyltransferase family 2 protein [Paenibacillus sp. OV219]SEM54440.1 Glycosyltransferase involved in cell wall bisynthesis [Paenibacillus sp. OV219]